jgi:bis(5'-adenosyl)-triphosphatase
MSTKECVYCTNPAIKERTIISNEFAWSFPTNIPIVPGHVLICPVRCVAKLEELTDNELSAILELRMRLKQALVDLFGATGFNYAWNEGELAGQSVPHFHLHMLPRKKGDTGITQYDPRQFLYRPGSREASPETELLAVAKQIAEAIKS